MGEGARRELSDRISGELESYAFYLNSILLSTMVVQLQIFRSSVSLLTNFPSRKSNKKTGKSRAYPCFAATRDTIVKLTVDFRKHTYQVTLSGNEGPDPRVNMNFALGLIR